MNTGTGKLFAFVWALILGLAAFADEGGFVRLFNGRDLDGWLGATAPFYAETGELVFRGGERNVGKLM